MKRLKHNFKKGKAFVLSLAMVAGLILAMSGGANTVHAATGTGTEPSVSAYATKEQMMDGTFAPKSDGTAVNYGKLVFGKNSSGTAQQWYILGKDEGVSGDNTIIFAASPIATGQMFNSSTNDKTYNYEAGTGYGESEASTTVYANHYGASDLRVALQSMATNTSYFTSAEQGLMNATTVTTKDTKNLVTYTNTDKLYALQGDYDNDKYLWAGTSDSTVLAMNSYWSSGDRFWLRSPFDNSIVIDALLAIPDRFVNGNSVCNLYAVQPASNLNLSSVLFASAATAASSDTVSGTITDGTAMTLRLNGTGKDIGTVTYNTTTGDIEVAKGSTGGDVALVVQGNDGTNNWYYSKKIDASETINVSAIVSDTNTPSSIDLASCKIWLEITDADGLIYAKTTSDPEPVDYDILDGANGSWTQNSAGSLSIRGSGAFSKFVGVKVDGTLVVTKDYTVKEGSTIVTLKADYLNTLSVETHTFEILWTDGSASTTFTIKSNTSDNGNNNQNGNNNSDSSDDNPSSGTDKKDDVPKTGDNTPVAWLFILSILSGTGFIITTKKRRVNLDSSKR